ncbi:MAG TPA: hypothetical protein VGG03_13440 [Thermoanaerobaculia bacterium]|jgi:hypothetical protein
MARSRFPQFLILLSASALALGAAGCSNGQSPTEPSIASLDAPVAAKSVSSVSDESRGRGRGRGGNDAAANDRRGRGRGGDDQAGDDRGRRGRGNNDDRRPEEPRVGQEFEATVVAVNGNTLTLAGGVRVVVNGQTQWNTRGDLFSLSQVAGAVAAGVPTRVEGRGVRQADGSILALTIKAETDEDDD